MYSLLSFCNNSLKWICMYVWGFQAFKIGSGNLRTYGSHVRITYIRSYISELPNLRHSNIQKIPTLRAHVHIFISDFDSLRMYVSPLIRIFLLYINDWFSFLIECSHIWHMLQKNTLLHSFFHIRTYVHIRIFL